MAEGSGKAREISLGDDFGDVAVKVNGAQVKISADGSVHGFPAPASASFYQDAEYAKYLDAQQQHDPQPEPEKRQFWPRQGEWPPINDG